MPQLDSTARTYNAVVNALIYAFMGAIMGDEYLVVGRELVKPAEEPDQCEPVERRPYELTLSVDVDIFGGSKAVALMHCLTCRSDKAHVLHNLVVRGHPQAWITCLTCGDGRPLSWTDIGLDDVDAQEPFFERLIQPACMTERPDGPAGVGATGPMPA